MTNEKDRDCENHECITYGGSDFPCRLCMLWEIADLKAELRDCDLKLKGEKMESVYRCECDSQLIIVCEKEHTEMLGLKAENEAWRSRIEKAIDEKIKTIVEYGSDNKVDVNIRDSLTYELEELKKELLGDD